MARGLRRMADGRSRQPREDAMNAQLPLHRRARTWYGRRAEPAEPLRRASPAKKRHINALRIAALPAQVREAPVDRRVTALL